MMQLGEFPTEEELKTMIAEVDQVKDKDLLIYQLWKCLFQDKNGTIELDEFLNMMATRLIIDDKSFK